MHFSGIAQYVHRYQSTLRRKKGRQNTQARTHIHSFPLSRFHWNSVASRPYGDKSGVKTHFSSGESFIVKTLQAKDKSMGVYGGLQVMVV